MAITETPLDRRFDYQIYYIFIGKPLLFCGGYHRTDRPETGERGNLYQIHFALLGQSDINPSQIGRSHHPECPGCQLQDRLPHHGIKLRGAEGFQLILPLVCFLDLVIHYIIMLPFTPVLHNFKKPSWKFFQHGHGQFSSGYEFLDIDAGREAIDHLFGTEPPPKLILLDLKLPKMGGLEVLQALRLENRTRLIPVVVFTSSIEQTDVLTSYDLGANSYIRKPVDYQELNEAIKLICVYWLETNVSPPTDR